MDFQQVSRKEMASHMARGWTLSYPEAPQTVAEIEAFHGYTLAGAFEEHWVNAEAGAAMTLVAPNPTMPPDRLSAEAHVASDSNYDTLIAFAERRAGEVKAPSLCVWTRSDKASRIDTLVERGYRVIQTVPSSKLDLPSFSAGASQDKIAQCPFEVVSLKHLEDKGIDWIPLLYETTRKIAEDVPDPHDFDPMPFEQYREMLKNPVLYNSRFMFVAMDEGRIVGYTRVTPYQSDPKLVATGMSGVLREYRRQGVVTALKVRAIKTLIDEGFTTLRTENDITNPMYELNLALGFVWEWDWVQYQRDLAPQE